MGEIKSLSIDFEMLLALVPNPYIVLDRSLRIAWMNEAYCVRRATCDVRRATCAGARILSVNPFSQPSHAIPPRKVTAC
jgi:hypothetical protein